MSRGEQARAEILDAAERLVAERGVQVPLREIAVAAGHRNNSAVNYHFQNRRELINAVVKRRLEPMERERAVMLDALDEHGRGDIDALLRILVIPLMSVKSDYYARFLSAAVLYLPTDLVGTQGSVWPIVLAELSEVIPTTDPIARRRRIDAVGITMFALLADWERRSVAHEPSAQSQEEIVSMLAALIHAPVP